MAGDPPRPPPFRASRYDLATGLALKPTTTAEAARFGTELAMIDPWRRYGTAAAAITGLLQPTADGGIRLTACTSAAGDPVGVMVIRQPWLAGPYMQFLAILPTAQGRGFGGALLDWFEAEARSAGSGNLWICATAFNHGAIRLYERAGFERAAALDSLIKPGIDEVLMRKRLRPPASPSDS